LEKLQAGTEDLIEADAGEAPEEATDHERAAADPTDP
jgi:hypothetical protein